MTDNDDWRLPGKETVLNRLLPRVFGAEVRKPLPTAADALQYAEHVISATESASGVQEMAPYLVVDDGDTWVITGTHSMLPSVLDPVRLRLRKLDASVVEYLLGFMGGRIAPLPRDAQPR